MADKKISALTAATTLDKTETFPIVQGGTTKKATIAQALAPITIDLATAGTMLAGVPAFPVDCQVYWINGLGKSGIDHVRTVGIVDANTSDLRFNNNCEAYLDGLGVYVPCTYDVATNTLSGEVILWAGDLSQSGTDDPAVDRTHINLFASAPSFQRTGAGEYNIVTPFAVFSTDNYVPYSSIIDIVNNIVITTRFNGGAKCYFLTGTMATTLVDNILASTYIEFKITL